MKLQLFRHIFEKYVNIKFFKILQLLAEFYNEDGQTWQTLFAILRKRLKKSSKTKTTVRILRSSLSIFNAHNPLCKVDTHSPSLSLYSCWLFLQNSVGLVLF